MGQKQTKDNVLIFGGYSHKNRGDHAMLGGMVHHLMQAIPDVQMIIYSTDPEKINGLFNAKIVWSPEVYFAICDKSFFKRLWFKKLFALALGVWFILNFIMFKTIGRCLIKNKACLGFYRQMLDAKALVLSGGGYLNSIWSLNELYPKAFIVIAAILSGVPVAMRSQTIGPFIGRFDRFIAKLIFNSMSIIGLRDTAESKKSLHDLNIKKKEVFTGDDSLFLPLVNGDSLKEIFFKEKIPAGKKLIGVNFRNPVSYGSVCREVKIDLIAALLDKVASLRDAHIVFLPISYNTRDDDRVTAEKIQACMKLSEKTTLVANQYNPAELKGLIGSVDIAIGISYHFLLFALSGRVPAVGLFPDEYYRRKNTGLFELYGIPSYCFSLEKADTPDAVINLINKLFEDSKDMRMLLDKKNVQMEKIRKHEWQMFIGYLKAANQY